MKDIPFIPPGKAPKVSENEIQRAVFKHLRQRPMPGVFAFHPKNGGIHQQGRARGINAGQGIVSGVPDVIAIHEGRVFALELKTDFGKVSDEQLSTMRVMQDAGAIVAMANGLNAALAKLEECGILRGVAA